jgi:Flp pilus assembly protein TadD
LPQAEEQLKTLQSLLPEDLGVTALRARWLFLQQRTAEIGPLVEAAAERLTKTVADKSPEQVKLFRGLGEVYYAVERYALAEKWFRLAVNVAPEQYGPLAHSLARQHRPKEAIDVCIEAAKADHTGQPAKVLAAVLLSSGIGKEDMRAAEPLLAAAIEEHKDDPNLLAAVGTLRVAQGRSADAVALYRQALRRQPRQVDVLNNLATLLAEQDGQREEALAYVDRAIQLAGPQPGLLDTKGMILVFEGKPVEAVPLLKEAASVFQADPRYLFHLAVAYDRSGDTANARQQLALARQGDLAGTVLTSKDQQLLAELEQRLRP